MKQEELQDQSGDRLLVIPGAFNTDGYGQVFTKKNRNVNRESGSAQTGE